MENNNNVLEIRGLNSYFFTEKGVAPAVDGLDLDIPKGKIIGLVGESGCGKSMTAKSIMGLLKYPGRVAGGSIRFEDQDLTRLSDKELRKICGNDISMIFQEPMTSLNPVFTVSRQVSEPFIIHQGMTKKQAAAKVIEMLADVKIPNPHIVAKQYPHKLSGGMRQRVMIAMALACKPKLLIADEPTTALDVTIQAQILKLIKDLQKEYNYTIVFITHDLGVVANIADRVAVLYAGQIIEFANVEELFYDPRHPYTWALLSSLPQLAERNTKLFSITGTPPSLYNKIIGDPFAPRNQYCLKIDTLEEPPMFKVTDTHYAKTWLLDPRAPKTEKPEAIQNIHEKLLKAYNL